MRRHTFSKPSRGRLMESGLPPAAMTGLYMYGIVYPERPGRSTRVILRSSTLSRGLPTDAMCLLVVATTLSKSGILLLGNRYMPIVVIALRYMQFPGLPIARV